MSSVTAMLISQSPHARLPYVNALKRREVHNHRINGVCVMSTHLDPSTVEILCAVQAAAMQELINAEAAEPSSAKEALARAKVVFSPISLEDSACRIAGLP